MSFVLLALILQQTPTPASPPAAARRAAPATLTVEIKVTDQSGLPVPDATVVAEGPARRDATTDARGIATLQNVTPGTYRVHAEAERFISLEKEATFRGATRTLQLALSRAPAAPAPSVEAPPPPPPAPPAAPRGAPGEPRVVSIPPLAEQSLSKREAVSVVPIACSGTSNVRLVLVKDSLPRASHKEESQTLYVVSGQITLTIDQTDQSIGAGWVGVVPREVPYAVTNKGKNPAVLLSVTSGVPCGAQ